MPVAVLHLNEKDGRAMQAWATLRSLDEKIQQKIEPMMTIRDLLSIAVQTLVFGDDPQDATHEIKLDKHHSLIFTLKDGKFNYDQTCDCDSEHPDEAEGEGEIRGGLAELLAKSFFAGR